MLKYLNTILGILEKKAMFGAEGTDKGAKIMRPWCIQGKTSSVTRI